jgi:hypothetical protein
MGKGKKDKAKGATLPKQVAGVKMPKKLRKATEKAIDLAREPVVAELVAAALLSAAAALRGDKAAAKAAQGGVAAAADAGRKAVKLGDSLRSLAIELAERTLQSWDRPAGGGGGGKTGGGRPKAGKG